MFLFFLLILYHTAHVAHAVSGQIDLDYIRFTGVDPGNGVSYWLGLPFAATPVGQYRWRAPVDPPYNGTSFAANTRKPVCLSNGENLTLSTENSEDCLYLDVYAPTSANTSSALPVFVWIQGGGLNSLANANYNATSLIQASGNNIIVVTFNYRVGMWGFLASKEVLANGDANVGALDQRKVFQWVQKYIANFGGNPNHVTIGGDSAGGGCVDLHLTAYGGRNDGLFHATAAESPSFGPTLTVAESQYQYDQLLARVGCNSSTDTIQCLRGLSSGTLQNQTSNVPYPGQTNNPIYMWSRVVDGSLITDTTYRLFAEGKYIRVPSIWGADTNDGTDFAPRSASNVSDMNTFLTNNFPGLTTGMLGYIDNAYSPGAVYTGAGAYWPPTAAAYGEMRYLCPGLFLTNTMSSVGLSSWNYHWNVLDPGEDPSYGYGVQHTREVNAIWGPSVSSLYPASASYVTAIQGYWTSFIRSKDPNLYRATGTPVWKQWEPQDAQRLRFDNVTTINESPPSDLVKRCAFFASIANRLEQ